MASEKEKFIEDLEQIADELQDLSNEESIVSAPKALKKLSDKLSDKISFLEDRVKSFEMKDEEE